MDARDLAQHNFLHAVQQNPYPGRGLVVGRASEDAGWLMVYWIMGRSANSRNRRLQAEGSTLRTVPVDPQTLTDASLIIYEAMLELPGRYLVSNGDQTRTLYDTLAAGGTFEAALAQREREPDAPNYTPRISALLDLPTQQVTCSILKANPIDPALTDRYTYRPAVPAPGLGVGLTTYRGDGHPLPSFTGEPLLLPCLGSPEAVLDFYWAGLNIANRVALAVKHIPAAGGQGTICLRNQY
ncbi:MAG: IMP cyclohydrolase [Candidatus Tectimicrobiota bacterium]